MNLYGDSGISLEAFIELLYQARTVTKERTASIRSEPADKTIPFARKPRMAYYFSVLEDLVQKRKTG